eukprot:4736852-Lingulodinium_polyedra.AAC.1
MSPEGALPGDSLTEIEQSTSRYASSLSAAAKSATRSKASMENSAFTARLSNVVAILPVFAAD